MKNNKKLVLGSVVALALSVGVVAPNFTKAEGAAPAKPATQSVGTNDAPGKTDAQKISEAQAKAKKQLDDAGVPFDKQKDVLASKNDVYNIEQKTKEILAAKAKEDKELAKTDLGKAKLAAKAELKKAGYQLGMYNDAINNATSLYEIEKVKEDLKANKSLKTLDEYNKEEAEAKAKEEAAKKPLADAKAAALAELQKAGLGNSKNEFVKRVNEATTPYDVEQAKEAGLEWAKENLTTIDDWNEKEASKTRKLTIDQWLELQKKKEEKPSDKKPEEKPEDNKKPEEKPSDGKKVTIDEWNLANAKKEAIEELKAAGIKGQIYFDQINKAKTVEGVEALKAEILKAHAAKPADKDEDKKPADKDEDKKPAGKDEDKKPADKDEDKKPAGKDEDKKPAGKDEDKNGSGAGQGEGNKKDKKGAGAGLGEGKEDTKKTKDVSAVKTVVKKVNNVQTGVAGLTGVVATLVAASAALFKSKRK